MERKQIVREFSSPSVAYRGTAAEYANIAIVSSGNSVLETIAIAFRGEESAS